jgi:hypothetical protein
VASRAERSRRHRDRDRHGVLAPGRGERVRSRRRAEAPLDKLLSFFIGVETLVQAYAKLHTPLPIEQERKKDDDAIVSLAGQLGKKVRDRVARLIRGASIREQFAFFAGEHHLGSEDTSRFDTTKKVRDSAVHGDAVDVTYEIAGDAEHRSERCSRQHSRSMEASHGRRIP